MSVSVAMFHPVLKGVSTLDPSGSLVLKIEDDEHGQIDLFFTESSAGAVAILNRTPLTPVQQVAEFVSKILQHAGFESFEYENVELGCCGGSPVSQTWYGHPSEADVPTDDDITWVVGGSYRPIQIPTH